MKNYVLTTLIIGILYGWIMGCMGYIKGDKAFWVGYGIYVVVALAVLGFLSVVPK